MANPDALTRDGWGDPFVVTVDDQGVVRVQSQKYDAYVQTHQTMFGVVEVTLALMGEGCLA